MKAIVIPTANFRREAKKLIKKYHSLKSELKDFSLTLQENPTLGVKITESTYKIRLAVKSKGKGKSGGLRIISFVFLVEKVGLTEIYLLSIYDKSDYENISEKLLLQLTEDLKIFLDTREDNTEKLNEEEN